MKILTVDDSKIIRRLISQAIELLDGETLMAENGAEALEVLQKNPDTALVLMDWNMPVMNGVDCLRAIKEDDELKHIPVMMVTTESESGRIAEAIRLGAIQYVTKPCSTEELAAKMLEALGQGGA